METLLAIVQSFFWVILVLVALAVLSIVAKRRYKVPRGDQALVITGGKKGMRVLPGKGAFVSPLLNFQYFSLGVMTVRSDDQETQTKTHVNVVVQWTAQLRADTETEGALIKAVQGFSGYEDHSISQSLQQTLDGEVRAVVATMTPEEVVQDKDGFSTKVAEGVKKRMEELGYQLVSLNIAEVTDRNGYYHNIAAEDREARRERAETLTAQANQRIAVESAKSDEASQTAKLDRDLNVAEKNREVGLRQSAILGETERARVDAEISGELQREQRNQELVARQGEVEVVREQQRQAAATARRDVQVTEAETTAREDEIRATAVARKEEIEAQSAATVAEREAEGRAKARAAEAQGEADAINRTTEARTDEIRKTGLAEAEVVRAQGEAEAASIRAKGEAEAAVDRLKAEALAANDGANLKVTLAQIQSETSIKVSTSVGEAMASIGEKATFIDMGGSSNSGGDLLSNVLGNVPELLKKLDIKSGALHGAPFAESIGSLFGGSSGVDGEIKPESVLAMLAAELGVTPESLQEAAKMVEASSESGDVQRSVGDAGEIAVHASGSAEAASEE